jgi:cytosine/adenosine deaminase-related metal-dependent hydrolase
MTQPIALPWTLVARWVFPVSGPPISDGILTIAGERIVSVEPGGRRTAEVDLGDVAILPGFVNAHTHLDLSGLRGRCPPSADFTAWLRQVIAHRRVMTTEQIDSNVRAGLAESLRHGTTLLGDITAGGASWSILADAPIRSVVFYEMLGLTKERADQSWERASAWLETHSATERCRPGLSPHAPYSVRSDLFLRAALLARDRNCPLAVHLAESREELELLHHQRGPFVAFLNDLGVWDADGLVLNPDSIMRLCNQSDLNLFVHCNYLTQSTSIPYHSTVIYCPRTHAAFGHAPHPFRQFLQRGIRIALGTDSLASNPDLSILAEIRHLHRQCPDVAGDLLLRMATLSGAEALGWAEETGSLEAGKSADLVVVPRAPGTDRDPYQQLLNSDLPVQRVLCRGQWIEPLAAQPPLS